MRYKILDTAIHKINEIEGIECQILGYEIPVGKQLADARILLRMDSYQRKYHVELKTKIVPAEIPRLKELLQETTPYILIAEYITTQAKEILRRENIPYLDTSGNIFINDKNLHIYIETNKTNRNKLTVGNRAFNKFGLKVVYQFLIHPEYINKPYRFIGEQATVTIDTVGRVIQDLLAEKHLVQMNQKVYQFVDRTKLFQEWVTAFNKNLRPKLTRNTFRWLDKDPNWSKTKLPKNTYWGGAVAAEQLGDYLIPDKAIIYTNEPLPELVKNLKIIPDPKGQITLMQVFWKNGEDKLTVDPILTYADLINDPNPRYVETAMKIYKEHVEAAL